MTRTKIFISYAHEDNEWLKLLRQHLGWLENNGQIEAFDDREIMAGEEWDPVIKQKLESADIIVLIISRHFLASKYCTTLELRRAMERHDEGSARIVGILARVCDWTPLPLSKLQILPKDGTELKPVANWRGETGRDEAYTRIAKQVRKIVEESAASQETPSPDTPPAAQPEAHRSLIAIPEPMWPTDLGISMPDSLLLRPESGVVPFHDYRRGLVDRILGWALTPQPRIAVRLQAGEGGVGKSRMMIEVCRRLAREQGWHAGFLPNGAGLSGEIASELACGKPCLVVLDYAETRRAEIVAVTKAALQLQAAPQIRIMLLAREGGDWWDQLSDSAADDPVAAGILRSPSTKTGPYRMTREDVPPQLRPDLFATAILALAQARGAAVPEAPPPDLSADHFGNVLLIHFAALARLRGFESYRDIELLHAALGHERHYWQLLAAEGLDADAALPAFEQALALITLLGGTRTAAETKAIVSETPRCQARPQELRERLFDLLRRLYPQEAGVSALQPDLLGERLVARAVGQDDELLDIALARRRDPAGAKHALTVLTRLARRDPDQQRLLSRALDRHLADHLQQSLEVGSETGAPMAGSIMETVRGKPRTAARQIIVPLLQAIPKETINLRDLAAAIAQINVEILGDKAKSKRGAKMSMQLLSGLEEAAERYEAVGDWTRAAAARQRLFEQARSLSKRGNPGDLERLSVAHDHLAGALQRIGDFDQALKHAVAAETGFRRLAERHPAEHQGNWATSLGHLASHLSDLGRFEEAIDKAQAAEHIWRELAERQPDAYRAVWATSLANLANHLSGLGRFQEAIEKAQAAEQIRRELAERQPDAYRADWARSLGNLANRLRGLGRFQEGIDKAQAAEHIWRELAERQPDAYRADWAWALGVLAESQLDGGDLSEAISIATQALHQFALLGQERLRLLADDLGGAHRIHGEALLGRGHASEGLSAASVSVEILRGVFDQRPPVAAEQLAKATLVKARCLRKLDKPREAARAITEALTLLLPLIEPYRAKLRRVVRDMLGELAETSPESLPAEPAAKVARLLDEERTAEAGGDPS